MSPVIDERVVQMEFDNSRFERNVSTSISTLDKLKSALKLDGASKGLDSFQTQANSFNLSGIGAAVETISSKFSVLGMIGVTALQNIVNKAVDAGEKLVKALTIDQVMAGWDKYAEKTTAVQTIMSATAETWQKDATAAAQAVKMAEQGVDPRRAYEYAAAYQDVSKGLKTAEQAAKELYITTEEFNQLTSINADYIGENFQYAGSQMDYVNAQMEKLNWFTDETSYSFTDMVSNIGKFTANNIPLSQATTAMQGIATWAAASGQSAGEASRAMYNMAQAIGVGSVKLQDWKSIENANMATSAFKQNVLDSAVAMGTLTKAADGTYKTLKGTKVTVESFSQTLSEGWFSKDVLLDTLDQYGRFTDELYKVSEASELTASDLLSLVEAQKKGQLSQKMLEDAVRDSPMTLETLRKKVEELASEENKLGYESFRAAQEAKTFEDAVNATKDAASTGWMNIFENIFGNYERARHVWTDFAGFLYDTLVSPLENLQDWSEGFVAPLDIYGRKLRNTAEATSLTTEQIFRLVEANRQGTLSEEEWERAAANAGVTVKDLKNRIEDLSSDSYGEFVDALSEASDELDIHKDKLFELVEAQKNGTLTEQQLAAAAESAGISIEELKNRVEELSELGNTSGLDRIVSGLKSIADFLFSRDSKSMGIFGAILEGFEAVLPPIEITKESVTAALKAFQEWAESLHLTTDQANLLYDAGKGLASILKYVGNTLRNAWEDTEPLRTAIMNLAKAIGNLVLRLVGMGSDLDEAGFRSEAFRKICDKLAEIINKVSGAIQKVDLESLKGKFSGLSTVFQKVSSAFSWLFNKLSSFSFGDSIGKAIDWIKEKFESLKEFISTIDLGKVFKGALGTGALALIGTKIANIISNIKKPFKFLDDIKEQFEKISDSIPKVLNGVSKALSGFTRKANSDALKSVGTAILLLAGALLVLGFVNYDKAIVGIGVLAGVLAGLVVAMKAMKGINKVDMATMAASMLAAAAAMLVLAVSLAVLAGAIALFTLVGRMDGITEGLMLMAATLGIVVVALFALSQMSPKVLIAAAALLVLSVSLAVLAGAMALFALVAGMNNVWEGLGLMAASIGVLTVALMVLSNMSPMIIVAAASLLVAAASLLVLAGAVAAFAAIAGMDNAWTGVAMLAVVLAALTIALIALGATGPMVIVGAAALLVAAAACIALAAAVAVVSAVLPLLGAGLAALGEGIGSAVTSIGEGVSSFLTDLSSAITAGGEALGSLVSSIGTGMGEAVAALGKGIGEAISDIIASVGEGIGRGITSISDAIGTFGDNLTKASVGIESLGNGVRSLEGISWAATALGIGELALALKKLKVDDLAANMSAASSAVSTACTSMVTAITTAVPQITAAAQQLGTAFVSGLNAMGPAAQSASLQLGVSATNAISAYSGNWSVLGRNVGVGFANGIYSMIGSVSSAASAMAASATRSIQITIDAHSPSRVTSKFGSFFGQGFANGIRSEVSNVESASESLANGSISVIEQAKSLISSILSDDFTPVISPVVDLSNVTEAANSISGSFANGTVGLSGELANGVSSRLASRIDSQSPTVTNNNSDTYQITNNIYASEGMDEEALAEAVMSRMQARMVRRNVAFGA